MEDVVYEAPLYWSGRLWGWVPIRRGVAPSGLYRMLFDEGLPPLVESASMLYDVRSTDFLIQESVEHDGWLRRKVLIADETLGPGDIEAIRMRRHPLFMEALANGHYHLMPRAPKGLPRNKHGSAVQIDEDAEERRRDIARRNSP